MPTNVWKDDQEREKDIARVQEMLSTRSPEQVLGSIRNIQPDARSSDRQQALVSSFQKRLSSAVLELHPEAGGGDEVAIDDEDAMMAQLLSEEVEGAPVDTPEEVLSEEPVVEEAPVAESSNSLFDEASLSVDNLFDELGSLRPPIKPKKIGEIGTITAIASSESPEEAEEVSQRITFDLNTYGQSDDWDQFQAEYRTSTKQLLDSYLWDDNEILDRAAGDAEVARSIKADIEHEKVSVDVTGVLSQVVAEAVADMSDGAKGHFPDFGSVILPEVWRSRAQGDALDYLTERASKQARVRDYLKLFLPTQGFNSNRAYQSFMNQVASELGSDMDPDSLLSENEWKTEVVAKMETWLTEPDISVEEGLERIELLISITEQILDDGVLDVNPLWISELMYLVKDRIDNTAFREQAGVEDFSTWVDALDTVDMLGWTTLAARGIGFAANMARFSRMGSRVDAAVTRQLEKEFNNIFANLKGNEEVPADLFANATFTPESQLVGGRGALANQLTKNDALVGGRVIREALEQSGDEAVEALGTTREQIAVEYAPVGVTSGNGATAITGRPTWAQYDGLSVQRQRFLDELQNLSVSDLFTDAELAQAGNRYANVVFSQSRGHLVPSLTTTEIQKGSGLIKLFARFGAKDGEGYMSLVNARQAAGFLFSDNYQIVGRARGTDAQLVPIDQLRTGRGVRNEYFVEVAQETNPNLSWVDALKGEVAGGVPGGGHIMSPSRRLDREFFNLMSSFHDKSTKMAATFSRMAEPIRRMRTADQGTWEALLTYGDSNEFVFSSQRQAERVLGSYLGQDVRVNRRIWDAYKASRDIFDSVADLRQRRLFNDLNTSGFKTLRGSLDDLDGMLHARPIANPERIPSAPKDGVPITSNTIWGDTIYDASTGQVIRLTDEVVEAVVNSSDLSIVRFNRNAEFPVAKGQKFSFGIVRNNDVTDLAPNPMAMRTGHVDRHYWYQDLGIFGGRGAAPAYKVQWDTRVLVNGQDTLDPRTVGVYRTKKEAEKGLKEILEQAGDMGDVPDIDAFRVVTSRETASELGLNDAGTAMNNTAHSRRRGEQVLGPDGMAETLDPMGALSRAMGEVRRTTGQDITQILHNRFFERFGEYMRGGRVWDENFDNIARAMRSNEVDSSIVESAREWHDIIMTMQRSATSNQVSLFGRRAREWAASNMEANNSVRRFLAKSVSGLAKRELDQQLLRLSSASFIASRAVYQLGANAAIATNLSFQDPSLFFHRTLPRTIAMFSAMAGSNVAPDISYAAFSRAWSAGDNVSPADFKRLVDHMSDSGFLSTSWGNDVMSLMSETTRLQAGMHNVTDPRFWTRMLPGGGGVERAAKLGFTVGRMGTDFAKVVAYNQVASRILREKGKDYLMSRRGLNELVAESQRLTFNQNRFDQFKYQQSILGMQFQFVQHVHRMAMDLMFDPAARVVGGRLSADGSNPYAKHYGQSVLTLLGMTSLYGAQMPIGMLDLIPGVELEEGQILQFMESQGMPPELFNYALDGIIGGAMHSVFDERVSVASRWAPIFLLRDTWSLMRGNDGGFHIGGPAATLWDTGRNLTTLYKGVYETQEISGERAHKILLKASARAFSAGWRDWEKAEAIRRFGMYRSADGRIVPGLENIGEGAAWPQRFGIPPKRVTQFWADQGEAFDNQEWGRSVERQAHSIIVEDLLGLPDGSTMNEVIDIIMDGFAYVDMAMQDLPAAEEVKNRLWEQVMSSKDNAVITNLERLISYRTPQEARAKILEVMHNHPEAAEMIEINFLRWIDEIIAQNEQEDNT